MPAFAFQPADYPTQPGCYLMRDAKSRVIYVGKAKSLRHRLSQYFQPSQKNRKAKRMIQVVNSIEVIIVNNEYESLVLENNLIKRYKPRFNYLLKDEASGYYYIQLTGEQYPRFLRYRKNRYVKAVQGLKETQESARFGPYLKARHREIILEYVNDHFGLRTCKPLGHRLCLRYHLGRCSGICAQMVSEDQYMEQVNRAMAFLSQPQDYLVKEMKAQMREYAAQLRFEQAQKVKEQIAALEQGLQKQIVETDVQHDQDFLHVGKRHVLIAQVRKGALQGMRLMALPAAADGSGAGDRFILTHYRSGCPDELVVNAVKSPHDLERQLVDLNQHAVTIAQPKAGLKRQLLKLCEQNYRFRVKRMEAEA